MFTSTDYKPPSTDEFQLLRRSYTPGTHADIAVSSDHDASGNKMKNRFDVHLRVTPTLFIGKWTVRVLFLLKERPYSHAQLRRRLGAISQRMLTRTLRNLESTGLISRKVTRSRSVTVSYSLTKLGRSFMVPANSVCRWIDRNRTGLRATIDLSK
jgi:DNA-binding HxlR family transcriptional regulator